MSKAVVVTVEEKFLYVLEQLIVIHQKGVKCSVSINFSGNPEEFTFRYTNIDPDNLHDIVIDLHNVKERERQIEIRSGNIIREKWKSAVLDK